MRFCSWCGHKTGEPHDPSCDARHNGGVKSTVGFPTPADMSINTPAEITRLIERCKAAILDGSYHVYVSCRILNEVIKDVEAHLFHHGWRADVLLTSNPNEYKLVIKEAKIYMCSICGKKITEGSFVGTGDGTGGSFAHRECYRSKQ